MNRRIGSLLANINQAYIKKIKVFEIEHFTVGISLCEFLISISIIQSYQVFTKTVYHNHYTTFKKFIRVTLISLPTERTGLILMYSNNLQNPANNFILKPYTSMHIMSRPGRLKTLLCWQLQRNFKINTMYIILTKRGFLTDEQAISSGYGGIAICKFIL